uniref:Peptidase C-terminal archaeal/bacterial domain-containing protein n=2 Tax=Paenibacillus athensensis TaxID=1967502 RepID=A0A4Y8PQ98_9BACL
MTAAAALAVMTSATSALAGTDIYENPNGSSGYSVTPTLIGATNHGTTANNRIVDFWNFTNDASSSHSITFNVLTAGAHGGFTVLDQTANTVAFSATYGTGTQTYALALIPGHQYQVQVIPYGGPGYPYTFVIS